MGRDVSGPGSTPAAPVDRAVALAEYLAELRAEALAPGRHDCALFAAGWVSRITGDDPAARWRGRYASLAEGRALLRREGAGDVVEIAAAALDEVAGWPRARTGDVAVLREAGRACFGIVGEEHIHVLHISGRGLDAVPLDRAERVFRP